MRPKIGKIISKNFLFVNYDNRTRTIVSGRSARDVHEAVTAHIPSASGERRTSGHCPVSVVM